MAVKSDNPILDRLFYDRAAREYCESLPLEHFMESPTQSAQRDITVESFALVRAARPEVRCYNGLLIQYPQSGMKDIGRVVPDNVVIVHPDFIQGRSLHVPLDPQRPFLAMEYVSEGNRRKDYDDNFRRYEQDLRVPYYLLFEPEKKQLLVFRLSPRKKYASVKPNAAGRLAVPELELEAGLVDGWVRFWFRGDLLELPADLSKGRDEAERRARAEREAREAAEAELTRLRAELDRLKGGGA